MQQIVVMVVVTLPVATPPPFVQDVPLEKLAWGGWLTSAKGRLSVAAPASIGPIGVHAADGTVMGAPPHWRSYENVAVPEPQLAVGGVQEQSVQVRVSSATLSIVVQGE
jgi:hypothetical protein